MSKKEVQINEVLKGYHLELLGDRKSGYCMVPTLDEGTIFYQGYICLSNTKTYKDLDASIKTWENRAKGLHREIRKYY